MKIINRKYHIKIKPELLLNLLKDKKRHPDTNLFRFPFHSYNCQWISGKLELDNFEFTDFRYSKYVFSLGGEIAEEEDYTVVNSYIKLSNWFLFLQAYVIVILSLIILFISFSLSYNNIEILMIPLLMAIMMVYEYLSISKMIKALLNFFEKILSENSIKFQINKM